MTKIEKISEEQKAAHSSFCTQSFFKGWRLFAIGKQCHPSLPGLDLSTASDLKNIEILRAVGLYILFQV